MNKLNSYHVIVPNDCIEHQLTGPIYGYSHENSGYTSILGIGNEPRQSGTYRRCEVIGVMASRQVDLPGDHSMLQGWYDTNGRPQFMRGDTSCEVEGYDVINSVFSRNSGILEVESMMEKTIIISGCGSVGSLAALELCRAGLGRFLLVDQDVLATHNLCRHQCSLVDVGRYKVDALRDRILDINPVAQVTTQTNVIQRVPINLLDEICKPGTVIIGAADNREGDIYANRIACNYGVPMVSISFWERAFAGEIFYTIPGRMPCYHCVFHAQQQAFSARNSQNRRYYTTQEDMAKVDFQPGISTDIDFVTLVGVKMAIDLLHSGDETYRPKLLGSLKQFTLVCNTNDVHVGGEMAEIFEHPLQITRSIEVQMRDDCPHCRLVANKCSQGD